MIEFCDILIGILAIFNTALLLFFIANCLFNANFNAILMNIKPTLIDYRYWFYKYFSKKRKLLTQEEYNKESREFTSKSLHDLKVHCASHQRETQKILNILRQESAKSHEKLDRFVNEDIHLSIEEINDYENYKTIQDEDDVFVYFLF